MLIRGSAQLLLLFFRSRPKLGSAAAAALLLMLAAALHALGKFPISSRMEFVEALRQSAWQQALAGLPEQAPWPWDEAASPPLTSVPRFGLSASLIETGGVEKDRPAGIDAKHADAGRDPHLPASGLDQVGIGDRITVTAADGSSSVYRVTGRKVVDPHLAETGGAGVQSDPTLVTCLPFDPLLASSLRLVIQATKVAPQLPSPRRLEQKL